MKIKNISNIEMKGIPRFLGEKKEKKKKIRIIIFDLII